MIKVVTREREGEAKKPTRYFSKKQEDRVAKALGGHRNLNSGATMFQPGDVQLDNWLLECKTKTSHAESITVKKDWIQKNKEESLFMGKDHEAVVISFGPDEPNYYIIDEFLFQDLVEYLKEKEGK